MKCEGGVRACVRVFVRSCLWCKWYWIAANWCICGWLQWRIRCPLFYLATIWEEGDFFSSLLLLPSLAFFCRTQYTKYICKDWNFYEWYVECAHGHTRGFTRIIATVSWTLTISLFKTCIYRFNKINCRRSKMFIICAYSSGRGVAMFRTLPDTEQRWFVGPV